MDEHRCDKGPLIERMIEQLDRFEAKLDKLSDCSARMENTMMGNGVPGVASVVGTHETRLDSVEASMLTHKVVRGLMLKMVGVVIGAVGLTETVIAIVRTLTP